MFTDMLLKVFCIYLIAINVIAFLLMMIDKIKAKKNKWRIPEATLFLAAAIGGSIGSLLGMYTFRHKTKHIKFIIGMPIILAAQIIIAILILN